ncbi:hypothetical protein C8F04DRAFT_59036 [Mycena alexandri]|uniref:Uncharacterized protein n=1 Tax=Mycena alexandri TaxID=1745969 RepID=A0AAD6X8F0_9AGAR|nr:hypothetical protein C8F04DRAFT_59036 [Mycena alexandri]
MIPTLLKPVRVRFSRKSPPANAEKERQKLPMLIQTLELCEKAAEASGVPYLKGAVAFALEVAKCVEGHLANNEDLDRLAIKCGALMLKIADQVKAGGGQNMERLVQELNATLEKVQIEVKDIVKSATKPRLALAHKATSERIRKLDKDMSDAQLEFLTLATIVKEQNYEQAQYLRLRQYCPRKPVRQGRRLDSIQRKARRNAGETDHQTLSRRHHQETGDT